VYPLLLSFPFKDSSPWMALDDGMWSSDVLEVSQLTSREVVVFGESWPTYLLTSLAPFSLCWVLDEEQQRGGVATRDGERCNGHGRIDKYVVRWWH
jgi:hypothetical protein